MVYQNICVEKSLLYLLCQTLLILGPALIVGKERPWQYNICDTVHYQGKITIVEKLFVNIKICKKRRKITISENFSNCPHWRTLHHQEELFLVFPPSVLSCLKQNFFIFFVWSIFIFRKRVLYKYDLSYHIWVTFWVTCVSFLVGLLLLSRIALQHPRSSSSDSRSLISAFSAILPWWRRNPSFQVFVFSSTLAEWQDHEAQGQINFWR